MTRKTSKTKRKKKPGKPRVRGPQLAYVYGLPFGPTKNAELVEKQIVLSQRYNNQCVEAERRLRATLREIYQQHTLDLMGASDEMREAFTEVKRLEKLLREMQEDLRTKRKRSRSRSDTPQERMRLREVRDLKNEAWAKLRELKNGSESDDEPGKEEPRKKVELSDELKARRAEAQQREKQELHEAYVQFKDGTYEKVTETDEELGKLYWGTYLLVNRAREASRMSLRDSLWKWNEEKGIWVERDPKFKSLDDEVIFGVELQKGDSVERVLNCQNTMFQLDMEPEMGEEVLRHRRIRRRGIARIRVGSGGKSGRDPIWAEFPVIMHRPLPPKARIKWAVVKREKITTRLRWTLHLHLEVDSGDCHKDYGTGRGVVAVDIGWRKRGTETVEMGRKRKKRGLRKQEVEVPRIRIAYLIDDREYAAYLKNPDEGEVGHEQCMSSKVVAGFQRVETLQQTRQLKQNEMLAELRAWIKARRSALPKWFRESTRGIAKWEAPKRFAWLLRLWRESRWKGDERGFEILDRWQRGVYDEEARRLEGGDRHLWQWQESQRRKSLLQREDHYRCVDSALAREFKVLVLENIDLSKMQKHELPGSDKVEIRRARRQQKEAALSEFRETLIQAFLSRGGTVVWVNPAMTTQRCFDCGHDAPWDPIPKVEHTCEKCGRTWDQDANAARNMMRLYRENKIVKIADGSVLVREMSDAQKNRNKGKKVVRKRKKEEEERNGEGPAPLES